MLRTTAKQRRVKGNNFGVIEGLRGEGWGSRREACGSAPYREQEEKS